MTSILLTITIILLSAFIGGELFKRLFNVSRVVGQIAAGIALSYFAKTLLPQSNMDVVAFLSTLGIIFLLLLTGIKADVKRLAKSKKEEAVVAFFAAVIPAALGFALMKYLGYPNTVAFVLGASLALTSEATKLAVLIEEKVLRTRLASIMLGAGIMDDLFEISFLAIVLIISHKGTLLDLTKFPIFIIVFIVAVLILFKILRHLSMRFVHHYSEANSFMLLLIFGLGVAALSEVLGLGPIIGAFIAGILIQLSIKKHKKELRLISDLNTVTFGLIVPFFFVFVGLNFDFSSILASPLFFAMVLAVATIGKISGALLASFSAKLTFQQSMLVGWGMNSRGAVELVIAEVAREAGLIPPLIYSSIVAVAVITTIFFPFALKFYLNRYPHIME